MANEQRGGQGNFANDPERASEAGRKGGEQSHSGQQNQQGGSRSQQSGGDNQGQQGQQSGRQGQQGSDNPGNFANDREKASEAGRKGGQS
jgi:uncharacterized protein